jgi:hypothetical protein
LAYSPAVNNDQLADRLTNAAEARWGAARARAGAELRAALVEHLARLASLDLSPGDEPDHARPEPSP